MTEVRETMLPGVGVRHEFTLDNDDRVAVLTHRGGSREIAVYDRDDTDACTTVLRLSPTDTSTLSELLGGTHVSEAVAAVQQQIEGLAIEWVTVAPGSAFVGGTIADGAFRTRTGASIVAVIRGDSTIPAPGPDHRFEPADVVVAVGTPDGLAQVRRLLGS